MIENKQLLISAMPPILSKACQISLEPIQLTRSQQYREIYQLSQSSPRKALEAALKADASPELSTLKAYLLLQTKQEKLAKQEIESAYLLYPGYLAAMINYADLCIRKKRLNLIPNIFNTFDLSMLFVNRTQFHASEFRGFMVMMAFYHLAIKQRKQAALYYTLAVKADPHHASLAILEKKLFPKANPLKKLLSRIIKL